MVAKEADPWCFMSSYPKINGKNVDAQTKFLIDILRKQWGYEGLVMSDWGASSSVEGIKYGYVVTTFMSPLLTGLVVGLTLRCLVPLASEPPSWLKKL
jgi:hypothetical protein